MVGMTVLSAVKVSRYLCWKCGYSEEWIDNKEDIKNFVTGFTKNQKCDISFYMPH